MENSSVLVALPPPPRPQSGRREDHFDHHRREPRLEVDEEEQEQQQRQEQQEEETNSNNSNVENNSQETFTQQLLTSQGNELTQLGLDDDDDFGEEDDGAGLTQSQDCQSPAPVDPLTVPWGRLMPVGPNNGGGGGGGGGGSGNGDAANDRADNAANGGANNAVGSNKAATEMLPRSPTRAGSSASANTRSRSPSVGSERGGGGGGGGQQQWRGSWQHGQQQGQQRGREASPPPPPRIQFLGLRNLLPSDRFNEYVLGRSAKADVTAQKLDVPSPAAATTEPPDPESARREEAKRRRRDYVHAMTSNRHCRVYCLLAGGGAGNDGPPEMEVFVEDTSGNGTLVNGTALLRRNERRRLHTGDVICLLNPRLLAKRIKGAAERKAYVGQYSYVFVNLYEQEARQGCWAAAGAAAAARPSSARRGRRAVDARATKCHSPDGACGANSKRSLFSATGAGGREGAGKANRPRQQQPSSSNDNDLRRGTRNDPVAPRPGSLGNVTDHRRIEEEYDLRDLLGTGTCGEVRRAIHRRTGEERAVKVIQVGGRGIGGGGGAAGGGAAAASALRIAAIRAEAEILRGLDHPYVVKLHDTYVAPGGGTIYLVMELVRGGDLFDRIVERERYTEVRARRLFRRMLTAVHYLHEERGIVHRDLKPENILVVGRRSDVDIKLTDFGLAKNMTAEGLRTFCGTPQYFAPEVLRRQHTVRGDGRYGKEIDCWSMGVILFILLSGSPPFDVSAGFDAVANAEVVFRDDQWRSVSRGARDLVARLLEKDPQRRMSVAEACEHGWVLEEDGDTHRHPLRDPVALARVGSALERVAADSTNGDGDDGEEPRGDRRGSARNLAQNDDRERGPDALPEPGGGGHGCGQNGAEKFNNGNHDTAKQPTLSRRGGLNNVALTENDNQSCASNAESKKQPPSSPRQLAPAPVDSNAPPGPISMVNEQDASRRGGKFQSLSAPQLSKDGGRHPSIWPADGDCSTTTKAIRQGCHATRPSPDGSPVQKRQLFERRPPAPKKMSRQEAESILAAGNTLPKPYIDEGSRLVEKAPAARKKVQSTLFASEAAGTKRRGTDALAPRQPTRKNDEREGDTRKSATSTVTPNGNEHNGVPTFRLNKKLKVGGGKYISPGATEAVVTNAESAKTTPATMTEAVAPANEAGLSEDELQSDFSDDEGQVSKSPPKPEKKPLEKFLRKRNNEALEGSAGVRDKNDEPRHRTRPKRHSREEVPWSLASKKSCDPPGTGAGEEPISNDVATAAEDNDRKFVQTYIFGKPPVRNNDGLSAAASPAGDDNCPVAEDTISGSSGLRMDGGTELRRQASGESADGCPSATAAPKGKQRSIKSWFRPRK